MDTEEFANTVLFITASNTKEAQGIANLLLNCKKAACVNIMPRVSSLFWWQDNIDSAQESLLMVKTKTSALDEIVALVKQIHSYDVPEIIALPVVGGNQDYLDWIGKEVK